MKNQTKIEIFSSEELKLYMRIRFCTRTKLPPISFITLPILMTNLILITFPSIVSGVEFCGIVSSTIGIEVGRIIVFEDLRQEFIYKLEK
jgi:hypothetical protein